MIDMIQLTPEELYFLGRIMKAKYIDFSYYAAMKDIQKQFEISERKALSGLGEKGLIDENFSGEIEVPTEVFSLMHPVFFGTRESRLKSDQTYTFHLDSDSITMGVYNADKGYFTFMSVSDNDLIKLLKKDCEIVCADVMTGYTMKHYSERELSDNRVKKEAFCILKGGNGNA